MEPSSCRRAEGDRCHIIDSQARNSWSSTLIMATQVFVQLYRPVKITGRSGIQVAEIGAIEGNGRTVSTRCSLENMSEIGKLRGSHSERAARAKMGDR